MCRFRLETCYSIVLCFFLLHCAVVVSSSLVFLLIPFIYESLIAGGMMCKVTSSVLIISKSSMHT